MSEQNDPFEARLRRLVADAVDDAPTPPAVEELTSAASRTPSAPVARRWLAGGTIGLVAAAIIALLVIPRGDDEDVRPVDTPPQSTAVTEPAPTIVAIDETVPPETSTASSVPGSGTGPENPAPEADPTVIAAVDGNGDAVLLSADGTDRLVLIDGPDPDLPPPVEGPGPNTVDGIALAPDGNNVFVGFCCEPIAGSILSGAPADLPETSLMFGYSPAISPDGRLLAVGLIAGPATALTDLSAGVDLDVPDFADAAGTYTPFGNVWVGSNRVAGIGSEVTDDGSIRWVAVPMTIDGDTVTVGETLLLDEVLTPGPDDVVRAAGTTDDRHFVVHVPGREVAMEIEFRMDGVTNASVAGDDDTVFEPGVGEPARSIWYRPNGPVVWVGDDGTLHRGDETIPGEYRWAQPTDAMTFASEGAATPSTSAETAIDVERRSVFDYEYGDTTGADETIARITEHLGAPTADGGWVPMPTDWACTGKAEARTVWWGDFRMTFERGPASEGLSGWSVGDPTAAFAPLTLESGSPTASGVAAEPGVGVGADRSEVLAVTGEGPLVQIAPDRIIAAGAISIVFVLSDDTVTGIGVGRNDCLGR